MSRARHQKVKSKAYAKGGMVKHMDEAEDKKLIAKEMGKMMGDKGDKGKKRMDRKHGGRVGSDKSPMAPGSAKHPFASGAR